MTSGPGYNNDNNNNYYIMGRLGCVGIECKLDRKKWGKLEWRGSQDVLVRGSNLQSRLDLINLHNVSRKYLGKYDLC